MSSTDNEKPKIADETEDWCQKSPINKEEKSKAVVASNDGYNDTTHSHGNASSNIGIQNVMINHDGTSNHQLGREATTSDRKNKGDLDGDLYQDHTGADHFVATVAIDLLLHSVFNAFGGTKDDDQLETKSRFYNDDPPTS